jgi:hypothetical protein
LICKTDIDARIQSMSYDPTPEHLQGLRHQHQAIKAAQISKLKPKANHDLSTKSECEPSSPADQITAIARKKA